MAGAGEKGKGLPGTLRRVLVVGASRSGLAAATVLARQGREVVLSDVKNRAELPGVGAAETAGVRFVGGPQREELLFGIDLLVKSPGVPGETVLIASAKERGVPVWGELELAYRLLSHPITAVTGTNGKTTTASLIGHIFAVAGRPARVLGNIGTPLSAEVGELERDEELVVEVSSFQLEDTQEFRPEVGILLNLTPDHLDRHGSMERYAECKGRLFLRQTETDWAVINADEHLTGGLATAIEAKPGGPRVLTFSTGSPAVVDPKVASWSDGERLFILGRLVVSTRELALRGRHNQENCLAAATAALLRGVAPGEVAQALRDFPGLPHRLEVVGVMQGVTYVNDSKATNVEATLKALDAYPRGTHLILGGCDKASDYRPLARASASACCGVYLIGEAAPLIEKAFDEVKLEGLAVPQPLRCGDLEHAVAKAAAQSRPGDTVLLAPACASFDQYRDFEERGKHFATLVAELGGTG